MRKECSRLKRIYKGMPPNQYAVVQGLIVQAARLRISLDDLWKDIEEHGRTELFSQSADAEPYQRERPAAKQFALLDKNYQALMKQLTDLCPASRAKSKLEKLMHDE
ncbi:MAG: hypothetical protein J6K32_12890 [Clostridia bacterium]|nr:hypothetical protein [Clostridia bacterium]